MNLDLMPPIQHGTGRGIRRAGAVGLLATGLIALGAVPASAQSLGTFRWQLQPYCNVLTLDVVQRGGVYAIDGYDDQCGLGDRASAAGTAALNADGSVMIGLTLVTSPGASPSHVSARLSPATLGGTWSDSGGLGGTFFFSPPPGPGLGPARPTAGLGVAAIDPTQVQRRVGGACPAGQAVRSVNQDGSVLCQPVTGTGGGTITGVTAGTGLTGGGTSGSVALGVLFAGPGSAAAAARSDHTHAVGAAPLNNLAIGVDAMPASTGAGNTAVGRSSLYGNTSGANNTAVGVASLNSNTAGSGNTAIGRSSLFNTHGPYGSGNTAVGYASMFANVSGSGNTAVGHSSLAMSTTGMNNTAIGAGTLSSLTTGRGNIAIGDNVGNGIIGGVDNIRIGNHLPFDESRTIRLGGPGQFYTFIAGVRDATTGNNDAVAVVIDSAGQLGTVSSSARFKESIADLGDVAAALQRLRPVQFRYRQPFADGSKPVQYGLIAEEVEAVLPALVAYDGEGQPASVKYHVLPALLLAEVQRLERERAAQRAEIASLREELARLRVLTLDHLSEPTAALERLRAAGRR